MTDLYWDVKMDVDGKVREFKFKYLTTRGVSQVVPEDLQKVL